MYRVAVRSSKEMTNVSVDYIGGKPWHLEIAFSISFILHNHGAAQLGSVTNHPPPD